MLKVRSSPGDATRDLRLNGVFLTLELERFSVPLIAGQVAVWAR